MRQVKITTKLEHAMLGKCYQKNKYYIFQHKLVIPIILLLIFFYVHITGCQQVPSEVQAVVERSGENSLELNEVINHYRDVGDKDKLKAAYFLISNLTHHEHFEGVGVDNYKKLFSKLTKVSENRKEYLEIIWDSLKLQQKQHFPGPTYKINDASVLTSKYLIDHIEGAFRAWNYPWARHLKFEEFCEYILPYKVVNEEPQSWNKDIQKEYNGLVGSMQNQTDPYEACLKVNTQLKKKFKIRSVPFLWDVGFKELNAIKSGKCYHATQYTAYIMRSLGIPVTMDFTPLWGNRNGGHEWNALIYKNKSIPFVGSESDPGKTKIDLAFQRKRGKVYRHTFSVQNDALIKNDEEEEVPLFFHNHYLKDVTKEYIPVTDVQLHLANEEIVNYVYLCVFNRQKWLPISIATTKDRVVTFKNMGRGIVYMPMFYKNRDFESAANPVLLQEDGSYTPIICDKSKSNTIKVSKKGPAGPSIQSGKEYELLYWDAKWVSVGKNLANNSFISFENVPANGLYWVKSSDKSSNERIFTVKDGKQVWW